MSSRNSYKNIKYKILGYSRWFWPDVVARLDIKISRIVYCLSENWTMRVIRNKYRYQHLLAGVCNHSIFKNLKWWAYSFGHDLRRWTAYSNRKKWCFTQYIRLTHSCERCTTSGCTLIATLDFKHNNLFYVLVET